MIAAMRAGHGVAMPAADFLVSHPYDVLVAGVLEAKHIGRGVVEGIECEHLAFRNGETDWQVWVEVGPKPMARKIVITSKTMAAAPQYTVRIRSWKTDVTPAAGTFTFVPPTGAKKLAPDALVDLDELPQGLPLEESSETSPFPFPSSHRPRRCGLGAGHGLRCGGRRRQTGDPGQLRGRRPPLDRWSRGARRGRGPRRWRRRARCRRDSRGRVGAPGVGVTPNPGVANVGGPVNRVGIR